MSFGLRNASSTLMRLIHQILRAFNGKFEVVYFNDIMVFSKIREDHMEHLKEVLQVLREKKVFEFQEV